MKKISILGVLIGGVVAVISDYAFDIPVSFYAWSRFHDTLLPGNQGYAAYEAFVYGHPALWMLRWLPQLAGLILGGYVAALISKHDELLNGALSAYLHMALQVYWWLIVGMPSHPLTHYTAVLVFLSSPALGLLGGWLIMAQRPNVRNVSSVLLAAALWGVASVFLILAPQYGVIPDFGLAKQPDAWHLIKALRIWRYIVLDPAIVYGTPFGVVSFTLCFYLFRGRLPLNRLLLVSIPVSALTGWIALLWPRYTAFQDPLSWPYNAEWLYTPALIGLLVSSIGLYLWNRRTKRSSSSAAS